MSFIRVAWSWYLSTAVGTLRQICNSILSGRGWVREKCLLRTIESIDLTLGTHFNGWRKLKIGKEFLKRGCPPKALEQLSTPALPKWMSGLWWLRSLNERLWELGSPEADCLRLTKFKEGLDAAALILHGRAEHIGIMYLNDIVKLKRAAGRHSLGPLDDNWDVYVRSALRESWLL